MKLRTQILFTILFASYLAMILLTDVSLTGFWTDVIVSTSLSIYALLLVFKKETGKFWLTLILKAINIFCTTTLLWFFGPRLINPFVIDTFKLRSFYYESVDGRLFNAYFKPVGAYSGGQGNFWISETPKYFPLIEWQVYWDRTVHHNFNDDTFEGEAIDNQEVVRRYIKNEVIDKQK